MKTTLKHALSSQAKIEDGVRAIQIVDCCWAAAVNEYFEQGVVSMMLEMIKIDKCAEEILKVLVSHQLDYRVVNEIYQRGLLNKLILIID